MSLFNIYEFIWCVKNVRIDFLLHTATRITLTAVYCRTPIMADVVVDKNFPGDCLVPKHETGVSQFLKKYPKYNGEGVTVAVLDSGVDPKACGLEVIHSKYQYDQ